MWGQIVQWQTAGSPRLDSNLDPRALCSTPAPPRWLWPSKPSPSREEHLSCPSPGCSPQGLADRCRLQRRVRRSIPLPGRESEVCLLTGHTDCCLLAGGSFRLELPEQLCLAERRVGMVWNSRCRGGWGGCLWNCPAV